MELSEALFVELWTVVCSHRHLRGIKPIPDSTQGLLLSTVSRKDIKEQHTQCTANAAHLLSLQLPQSYGIILNAMDMSSKD